MKRERVGILIFPNVEVLDFCGPYEVFSVTRLHEERRREESSPFEVLLVAERADPLAATGGLRVIPDATLETCPPLDILVVPGGWGTRQEISNQRVLTWIAERAKEVTTLTSVCTGAMLLGQAGLLDGRRATTHWRSLDWMRQSFPAVTVEDKLHVVEDSPVLTYRWDLSGYRHGAAGGRPLLRRSSRSSDGAPHGISFSRRQSPARLRPRRWPIVSRRRPRGVP
jgi:transcriptional regulator GlxA family with amidase domain